MDTFVACENTGMRTITAEELQAACMEVLQQVQTTGQPVRITLRGKPLATILPFDEQETPKRKRVDSLGSMAHCTKLKGDITTPSGELTGPDTPDESPREKTPKKLGTAVKGGKILGDIMAPSSELVRWEAMDE